jgi:hypothetical protein
LLFPIFGNMKKLCALLLSLTATIACAQTGAYTILQPNGLLYTNGAILALGFWADSLNTAFAARKTPVYHSVGQAYYAHYIKMQGAPSLAVKQDIDAGMGYAEIRAKYPGLFVIDSTLATRSTYQNFEEQNVLRISMMAEGRSYNLYIDFEGDDVARYQNADSGWMYSYDPPGSEFGQSIQACYISQSFEAAPLPQKYARLVDYAQFIVPSNKVFYEDAKRNDVFFGDEPGKEMAAFLDYANAQLGVPVQQRDEAYKAYYNRLAAWEATKWQHADRLYSTDREFKRLLREAYLNTKKGDTDSDFEDYIERYYSSALALEYKRSRIIFGSCNSRAPRKHMLNIAKLAAHTANWQVFICAHLSIMDERFEVDEANAKGNFSYTAELEATGVNVADLLIGAALRIDNAGEERYEADVNDVGMMLAEIKGHKVIGTRLLDMIQDIGLDVYNRLIMCYVFISYNTRLALADEAAAAHNWALFNKAAQLLPVALSRGLADNPDARFDGD